MIKFKSILNTSLEYILRENDFTLGTDDLELAKDFNVKYLTVGDTVTPEMWDLDSLRNKTNYDWYLKPHEITRFGNWGPDSIVEFDGDLFYGWDWVGNHLKSQYQIERPLDESFSLSDDDFELAKDFNIKYLKPGDTIKGKMWNWIKIINMVNIEYRDDHESANRDIKMWEKIYDEGVTIEAIKKIDTDPWIDFGDGLLGWGPSVGWINNLLSPGYKIELPLDESFSLSDDDLEMAKNFNVRYLTVGDFITPEMWDREKVESLFMFSSAERILFQYNWKIVGFNEFGNIKFRINKKYNRLYSIGFINACLKSEYKIEESLDESFSLSDDDLELAKRFNTRELSAGDIITPDMWKPNFKYKWNWVMNHSDLIKQITSEPQIIEFVVQGDELYFSLEGVKDLIFTNDNLKSQHKVVNTNLDESFSLGTDDLELAKSFSPNPDIQVDVHVIYDFGGSQEELEHETTFRFLFKLPDLIEFIDEEGYENITETDIVDNLDSEWLDDLILDTMNYHSSNHSEIDKDTIWNNDTWFEENCSKVLNPVDWSKVPYGTEPKKRELDITIDLLDPSKKVNETFELSDDDLELAKDFNIKELKPGDTIEPEMWNDFFGDDLQTRSAYISNIYDDEDGEVVTLHQNGYDFDFDLEDINDYLKPKYRIIDLLDESFELGDEDIELAKGFNQKELKVGNYFYDSTNPEYAGAWTKLEDAPSLIRNFVKKIIYIGPNEGQYKESSYYDDDIVAFEFAVDPENVYTLTVNYFNRDFSDSINAYIPTKDNIDETFERGPEDIELANGLNVVKYLEVGNQITPNMWDPTNSDLKDFIGSRDEKWTIDMIKGNHLLLSTEMGDKINTDIETFNSLLKPEYIIE